MAVCLYHTILRQIMTFRQPRPHIYNSVSDSQASVHLQVPFLTSLKKCFPLLGQSVYWQNIFQKSPDPTFVLLTFIWHTVYAWDEALEDLYNHICTIVGHTILYLYSAYVGI